MAIGAATPHRARVRREQRTGARVEGRAVTAPVWSPSFRCRFTESQESESRDASGVRRVKPATLLLSRNALRAAGIDPLKASDRVEVVKNGVTLLMEVMGEPKAISKRRTVIGYVASLSKVQASE